MFISRLAPYSLAVICLCALGCGGGTTAKLLEQLRDKDPQVRRAAARALTEQHTGDQRVVSALGSAVGDTDSLVREAAIAALGEIGFEAKSSLASLQQALNDTEPSVRLTAALAIHKIDPKATGYQQVLVESLRSGNAPVFLEVGRMGREAEWAVATLVKLLSHQQTHMRALAAQALGEIGIVTDAVDSALQRHLQDREPAVQRAAEAALEKLHAGFGREVNPPRYPRRGAPAQRSGS